MWWIVCGLFIVAAIGIVIEPRQLWPAGLAVSVLFGVAFSVLQLFVDALDRLSDKYASFVGTFFVLALFLLLLAMVVLGVVLLLNGFVMWHREGHSLGNSLSLLAGIALLGYLSGAVLVVMSNSMTLFVYLVFVGLPVGYLSYGFLSYVLYSACYQWFTKRFAKAEAAVVVLGSGLVKGQVPPLLASRLDTGYTVFDAALLAGYRPLLVVSGGQGGDEPRTEADAMAEYLIERGAVADEVVREVESRNTQQNIVNTKALLEARGISGKVVAVTSNFHAFRAATLMRRAKLAGHTIGAPTAGYFWPSATLREYVALLRDSFWLNKVGLALSCLPLLGFALYSVIQMAR
ncbi:MAG: YdcF family protein [Propionibacteriaceae bacterium]|jgi:uncharacterized SAM-binding protein YcdF (DUF218 family)|nr:YdcF family protein [Propionibacteriaceae bacterium]